MEYTVDCAGNSDTFLDDDDSFADEVTLDKTKVVEVQCVGELPCFLYGVEEGFPGDGDAPCNAATGTVSGTVQTSRGFASREAESLRGASLANFNFPLLVYSLM